MPLGGTGLLQQLLFTNSLPCLVPRPAAKKVLIVPGYGLAAANAQYAIADLAKALQSKGIQAK